MTAAYTFVKVVFSTSLALEIKFIRGGKICQGTAHKVFYPGDLFFNHEIGEPFDHILHNAISIVDNARGDLDGGRPQKDIFKRIHPGFDSADARQGKTQFFAFCHLRDKSQANGLDRRPRGAADGPQAKHIGFGGQHIQVDLGNTADCIDGGDGIGTSLFGIKGRLVHVRDIGGHFCHYGYGDRSFYRGGKFFNEIKGFAHMVAGPFHRHMGAGKI